MTPPPGQPSTFQALTDLIDSLPEIDVLRDVARRIGRRFLVRGGLVRSLILSVLPWNVERQYLVRGRGRRSLFDYVEVLSDIDIGIDVESEWPFVAKLIASALPLSGFFRWEVRAIAQLSELRYETIALDQFQIVFSPDGGRPQIVCTAGEAEEVLASITSGDWLIDTPRTWNESTFENLLWRLTVLLKCTRHASYFRNNLEPVWRDAMGRLADQAGIRSSFQVPELSGLARLRLNFLVADCLFNSLDLKMTLNQLAEVRARVPGRILQQISILDGIPILRSRLMAGSRTRIGVRVRGASGRQARPKLLLRDVGESRSQIPWTRVPATTGNKRSLDSCCNFGEGEVSVISWRDSIPLKSLRRRSTIWPFSVLRHGRRVMKRANGRSIISRSLGFTASAQHHHSIPSGRRAVDRRYRPDVLGWIGRF